MWGANTFPSRNRFPYPISRSQDRALSLLGFRDAFAFLLLRDKKRSMATSLIQLSDDVQPVVSMILLYIVLLGHLFAPPIILFTTQQTKPT